MMTRKRAAAEVATPDEDQTRHVVADSEAIPDDLAAAAEIARRRADETIRQAEEKARELGAQADAAEREAVQNRRQAEQKRSEAQALMTAARAEAAKLEEHGRYLTEAVNHRMLGEEALERARALQAEREDLVGRIEDTDATLAWLGGERQRLAGQHAAALVAADLAAIADLRARLDAADEAERRAMGDREDLAPARRPSGTARAGASSTTR